MPQIAPVGTMTDESGPIEGQVSVVVLDGQTLFRCGVSLLLSADPGIRVVAEAGEGLDAVDRCIATQPDVVLTDRDVGSLTAVELIERLAATCPATRVLVLAALAGDDLPSIIRAGAAGYILKDTPPRSIISSIVAVHHGAVVLCPEAAARLLDGAAPAAPDQRLPHLTARQRMVLDLLAAGAGTREISEELGISDKTVRNHISRLYTKLSLRDRSHVVLFAVEHGLLASGPGPGAGAQP